MSAQRILVFSLLLVFLLVGCSSGSYYAPVVSVGSAEKPKDGLYHVQAGDTVYSIAWAYGLDYRELAANNHIEPPYSIHPGQSLRLMAGAPDHYAAEVVTARTSSAKGVSSPKRKLSSARWHAAYTPKYRSASPVSHQPITRVAGWKWPAYGRVVAGFSTAPGGNPGINIAGHYGEAVLAAANGVVVYSGAGVRGYGNLIIVKHSDSFLSAYAFNKRLLVKAGARVQSGQKIAEMGRDNAGQVLLHFEIRRNGAPVNPMAYLKG